MPKPSEKAMRLRLALIRARLAAGAKGAMRSHLERMERQHESALGMLRRL